MATTKRPALKEFHVSFKLNADVDLLVSAATPEEAIAKGRDLEGDLGNFLSGDIAETLDGKAEVRGCWALD
ncbi:MAG TPA: hypothetical protein VI172_03995 [Candidatus Dormibacteraeota bacterium]|jgi:hypothetical protein